MYVEMWQEIHLFGCAQVTFYTKTQVTGKGKKAKTNTTKEVIGKEFTHNFVNNEVKYHAFLQMILDKHHLSKYKVSPQAIFLCKVQIPPAKWVEFCQPLPGYTFILITCYFSSKSDATYIINFDEYMSLVTKINKRLPSRPIIVFVEMPQVEKVFLKVSRANLCICCSSWLCAAEEDQERTLFTIQRWRRWWACWRWGESHVAHKPFTPLLNHTNLYLGLVGPHKAWSWTCMIPLDAWEEVWHWPWWHLHLHQSHYCDHNPIDSLYAEGVVPCNGEFDSSILLVHILIQYYTSMMVLRQWTTHQTQHHLIQQIASHCLVHRTPLCLQAQWRSLHCQLSHHYSHLLHHSCTRIVSCHCLPPLVQISAARWPAPLSTPHQPYSTPHQNWNTFSKLQSRMVSRECYHSTPCSRRRDMGQISCTLSVLATLATLAWPQVMLSTWGNMPQGGGLTNFDVLQSAPVRQRHQLMPYHRHLNLRPQARSCVLKSATMEGGVWWLLGLLSSQGPWTMMRTMCGGFTWRILACTSPSQWERCPSFLMSRTFLVLAFCCNTLYFYMCCLTVIGHGTKMITNESHLSQAKYQWIHWVHVLLISIACEDRARGAL